jgi:hypothetical protein
LYEKIQLPKIFQRGSKPFYLSSVRLNQRDVTVNGAKLALEIYLESVTASRTRQGVGGYHAVNRRVLQSGFPAEPGSIYQASLPGGAARRTTLRLIPYYAWSNRQLSAMQVWMPYRAC